MLSQEVFYLYVCLFLRENKQFASMLLGITKREKTIDVEEVGRVVATMHLRNLEGRASSVQ